MDQTPQTQASQTKAQLSAPQGSAVGPTSSFSDHVVEYIDHHHPRLGSFLLNLRFGGLRTIEPTPVLGAAVVSAGTGAGLGLSRALGRGRNGRLRVPLSLAAPGLSLIHI